MLRIILAAFLLVTASDGFAMMDSLSSLQWKNRVVLVFGKANDPEVARQEASLRSSFDGLAERDLVIVRVSGDKVRVVYGNAPALSSEVLRREAKVSDDEFSVVLVGKDGSVKLRSAEVVGNDKLFSLIDSMPMRRAERR